MLSISYLQNAWRDPRQQIWIAFPVLCLLSFALYFPSFYGDFIWDGAEIFLNDPSIRDTSFFSSYFTEGASSYLEKQGVVNQSLGYYRPVIRTLHFLEYKVFLQNPAGYHAVSITFNMLVVLAAFLLVREITQNPLVAFVSAALFSVHPSHVEAVSWAYSDSYLVFSLFCLLSFYWSLKKKLFLSLASFAIALFSQESAILLPIVLVLERFLVGEKRTLGNYRFLIPYLLLVVLYLLVRSFAVGGVPVTSIGLLPWLNAVSTILVASVKIFFIPDAAIALYYNRPGMFAEVSVVQGFYFICVLSLCLFAVWLWKRHRSWLFWYLWFFVWLLVTFNVGEFAHFYLSDKILYLGSLGFCVLLAKGLTSCRFNESVIVVITVCCVVVYFSVSMWRQSYFMDEKSYFEQAVKFAPDFPLLRYSAGMMYLNEENYNNAEKEFNVTVKLDPKHSYAYNNIGNIRYMRSDIPGALNAWQHAITADPSNPQPYYNIGVIYDNKGDVQQALRYYKQYISRQPNPPANILERIQRIQNNAL